MTLSEMPKQIAIQQPVFELQLGIPMKTYILEVISMRTIKHKMVYDVKPEPRSYGGVIKAPSGYRISRIWKERVSVETELAIN
jgi:hypothetical protein